MSYGGHTIRGFASMTCALLVVLKWSIWVLTTCVLDVQGKNRLIVLTTCDCHAVLSCVKLLLG